MQFVLDESIINNALGIRPGGEDGCYFEGALPVGTPEAEVNEYFAYVWDGVGEVDKSRLPDSKHMPALKYLLQHIVDDTILPCDQRDGRPRYVACFFMMCLQQERRVNLAMAMMAHMHHASRGRKGYISLPYGQHLTCIFKYLTVGLSLHQYRVRHTAFWDFTPARWKACHLVIYGGNVYHIEDIEYLSPPLASQIRAYLASLGERRRQAGDVPANVGAGPEGMGNIGVGAAGPGYANADVILNAVRGVASLVRRVEGRTRQHADMVRDWYLGGQCGPYPSYPPSDSPPDGQ